MSLTEGTSLPINVYEKKMAHHFQTRTSLDCSRTVCQRIQYRRDSQ